MPLFRPCDQYCVSDLVLQEKRIIKGCDTCRNAIDAEMACKAFRERWIAVTSSFYMGGHDVDMDQD